MDTGQAFRSCLVATLLAAGANLVMDSRSAAAQEESEGVEVLTRGPVHEAFAELVTFEPAPGIVIPRAAPELIEELPPDQRPEGDNINWIPGYFAWDEDREDFLWVSGIWRDLPPGRQWVPGYWTETSDGFQWISGYWADATVTEIQYLPEPPATVEVGPNIDAPDADHTWLPGCWIWHQDRYAWRPGYWAPVQQNWVWVPAHYVWTPRGYVFVDGYNDYSVVRRGVLFAPVYFDSGIYSRQGYSYSPQMVINLGQFTSHLFSRPRYGHYYIGDYYASSYNDAGYYPWFSYANSGYGYDPFYAGQLWNNRQNQNWASQMESNFQQLQDNEDARPPRTFAAQSERLANNADATESNTRLALSLNDLVTNQNGQDGQIKFQAVDKVERQQLGERRQEIREFLAERQRIESDPALEPTSVREPNESVDSQKVKVAKSPIAAKSDVTVNNGVEPPKAQEVPDVDPNVEPKPRTDRKTRDNPATSPTDPNSPREKNRPAADGRKGKSKNVPVDEPDGGKKGTTKSDRPKTNPKSDRPKVDPKPDSPDPDTKPGSKSDRPKADPRPDRPKADPRPDRPKADQKPDSPDPDTKPGTRPDRPKADPKPDRPKVDPKPDVPKPDRPKVDPKPDRPKVDPKPDVPKPEPKPDRPNVDPKPERPKADPKPNVPKPDVPKPNPPKVVPKPDVPKPNPPRVDPKPDVPKPNPPKVDPKPEVPKVKP